MLTLSVPDLGAEELLGRLRQALGYPVQLFSFQASTWEEYIQRVPHIGEVLGVANQARRWVSEVLRRKDFLQHKSQVLSERLSVSLLMPGEIPHGIGRWATQLAEWAGLRVAFAEGFLSWERFLEADPDVVVVTFPGASLSAAGEALSQWARLPQVQHLKAFRQKRLYAFKGTAGFFFPSPYLIAAAEALYELAYTPTYRYNQHLGTLWAPLL
jgi:ABC-type Fe3+-hydroxamate transport system substrate-binding protein